MLAKDAIQGQSYRVLACPPHEYLTIGQVYECTTQTRSTTGLHRAGGGTYLSKLARASVVLEPV